MADVLSIVLSATPNEIRVSAELATGGNPAGARADRSLANAVQSSVHSWAGDPLGARLEADLERISRELTAPLADLLEQAAAVAVQVDGDTVGFPFDLLSYDGVELFLQKPVFYTFGYSPLSAARQPSMDSALIVSDKSADPERACATVAAQLERRAAAIRYVDVSAADRSLLEGHGSIDLLLMSVHGKVFDSGTRDYVQLPAWNAQASDLAVLAPDIAYFDACHIGLSRDFVSAFQEARTRYLLAPVLGNESGDSSTFTMTEFFTHPQAGVEPVEALFLTRRALFHKYRWHDSGLRLWRAFAFRVYWLDGPQERAE